MSDILIVLAHPSMRHSRVNAALLRAVRSLEPAGAQGVPKVRDLYSLYPDYFIDVAAEQAALTQAQLVVWQHPVHWYSMPALMKLWADEVLRFGWAYGPGGQALRGKWLWPVLSTGGSADSYQPDGHNQHPFEAFLPPYRQTAALCGMHWVPPLVLHGAHQVGDTALTAHVQTYETRLRRWMQASGDLPDAATADHATSAWPPCDVIAGDRPPQPA